ncbi:hypothetical protein VOLCADRAFT_89192 [Volvox carteri f. nagariensis]|uniref:Inner centromere protein ARK-binding domain-containing protein n=1 Tax=Volvox carteri f. nagariensis TaxID=3068 RepID=D8TR17_VOLCA|nr:uncharacterized protein VOLCADRAFT_89192 [Volvox carteri f. nagariensis]EFJ50123.1 hypothetical protein VOLCADRAFT_89192 [Volvox carteri f. nagariensis]|eukprot:XP_002948743.1 hypothetical protein VOLCADRAFT_89192 [Volvox carteri f. nagariensis]
MLTKIAASVETVAEKQQRVKARRLEEDERRRAKLHADLQAKEDKRRNIEAAKLQQRLGGGHGAPGRNRKSSAAQPFGRPLVAPSTARAGQKRGRCSPEFTPAKPKRPKVEAGWRGPVEELGAIPALGRKAGPQTSGGSLAEPISVGAAAAAAAPPPQLRKQPTVEVQIARVAGKPASPSATAATQARGRGTRQMRDLEAQFGSLVMHPKAKAATEHGAIILQRKTPAAAAMALRRSIAAPAKKRGVKEPQRGSKAASESVVTIAPALTTGIAPVAETPAEMGQPRPSQRQQPVAGEVVVDPLHGYSRGGTPGAGARQEATEVAIAGEGPWGRSGCSRTPTPDCAAGTVEAVLHGNVKAKAAFYEQKNEQAKKAATEHTPLRKQAVGATANPASGYRAGFMGLSLVKTPGPKTGTAKTPGPKTGPVANNMVSPAVQMQIKLLPAVHAQSAAAGPEGSKAAGAAPGLPRPKPVGVVQAKQAPVAAAGSQREGGVTPGAADLTEEDRRNVLAIQTSPYVMQIKPRTPAVTTATKPLFNYKISTYRSDSDSDSCDDEDGPGRRCKPVPAWAAEDKVLLAVDAQAGMNADAIFGSYPRTIDVVKVFSNMPPPGDKDPRGRPRRDYRRRGSSGNWELDMF